MDFLFFNALMQLSGFVATILFLVIMYFLILRIVRKYNDWLYLDRDDHNPDITFKFKPTFLTKFRSRVGIFGVVSLFAPIALVVMIYFMFMNGNFVTLQAQSDEARTFEPSAIMDERLHGEPIEFVPTETMEERMQSIQDDLEKAKADTRSQIDSLDKDNEEDNEEDEDPNS